MINSETVFTVIIPNWENKVKIGVIPSEFYGAKHKLPPEHEGAKLKKFGRESFYVDSMGKRILKNPNKKGNPKYWNLNGQDFYSNNMNWQTRVKIVNYYHRYFKKYIEEQLKEPFPIFLNYNLSFDIEIQEVYSTFTPDITNMWILPKLFEDALVSTKKLKNDSPEFRCHTGFGYKFVEKEEDRKLVITFKYTKK
jgi:hypothetical protein